MGICGSSPEATARGGGGGGGQSPEAARSKELDRLLKEDEKRQTKEVKLLLLGAGESGKSTILKSMRLIHNIPFGPSEKEQFRRLVFTNIVTGIRQLLEAMEEWGESFENPRCTEYLPLFIAFPDIAEGEPFPRLYYEPLKMIWEDGAVQVAYRRAHEIALPENLTYYCSDLDRLFQDDYIPTDADILRCRNKTTGIIETVFPLADKIYRIFDVGGQRSERKKWIHCFEEVTAVLFIVALSGYDCCLVEDKDSNQMQEALMLFDSICNSKWFVRTSMILFLNKVDIFKLKIATSPIKNYFPDYDPHGTTSPSGHTSPQDGTSPQQAASTSKRGESSHHSTPQQTSTRNTTSDQAAAAGASKSQSSIDPSSPTSPTDGVPASIATTNHSGGQTSSEDFHQAKSYFKNRFLRLNRSQTKEVYASFTNATDPKLLKIVMASVTDIILTSALRDNML